MNTKIFKKVLKNLSIFIIIIFCFKTNLIASDIKIIFKINNNIITNYDIEKEIDYLKALNPNLENVEKNIALKIARDSLVKETIKRIEILNYLELGKQNQLVDETLQNFYKSLNILSKENFETYLAKFDLNFEQVYSKFEIEILWNQLIYSKYSDQININKEEIKKSLLNSNKEQSIYNISEIVYEVKDKDEIQEKYIQILNSIKEIGFEKTVLLFSVSKSRDNFGLLGWVNESILLPNIKKNIGKMMINQISEPINVPAGILLLKLNDLKKEQINLDIDKEVENEINRRVNEQLNNFSLIYYNKIKNNIIINEY